MMNDRIDTTSIDDCWCDLIRRDEVLVAPSRVQYLHMSSRTVLRRCLAALAHAAEYRTVLYHLVPKVLRSLVVATLAARALKILAWQRSTRTRQTAHSHKSSFACQTSPRTHDLTVFEDLAISIHQYTTNNPSTNFASTARIPTRWYVSRSHPAGRKNGDHESVD